jgi:hypothetical protein
VIEETKEKLEGMVKQANKTLEYLLNTLENRPQARSDPEGEFSNVNRVS